jgi:hypothetical protein
MLRTFNNHIDAKLLTTALLQHGRLLTLKMCCNGNAMTGSTMPMNHHTVYERARMLKLRRVPIVCTIFLLDILPELPHKSYSRNSLLPIVKRAFLDTCS